MAVRTVHLFGPPSWLRRVDRRWWTAAIAVPLVMVFIAFSVNLRPAAAAEAPVTLGTTAGFSVLAGSTVTNTGPTVISNDVGLHPGTSITGFPPGTVNGTIHATDAVAQQAKSDLVIAYNDAASRGPGAAADELGGRTLVGGVYTGPTLSLTGTVTLDGQNDPNSVFIFQSASTLITASNSTVALINGAQACNVFWQLGSSATLGTDTTFVGTILALTSIAAQTATTVNGRLLARNGAVTLDDNDITTSACTQTTSTTTTTTTTTTAPPTSTTTVPPTSTTTVPPTSTTTVPPTSTTTVPPTSTTTVPPTSTTTAPTITATLTTTTAPTTSTTSTTSTTTAPTTTTTAPTTTTTAPTTTTTAPTTTTTAPTTTTTAPTTTTTAPTTTTTAPTTTTTTTPTTTTTTTPTTTTAPTTTTTTAPRTGETTTPSGPAVPGPGAPRTGDTGQELPPSPLNGIVALSLLAAAGALAVPLRRRVGRR